MKTQELISAQTGTPAKIAREIVDRARKTYVQSDVQLAVDKAIAGFVNKLQQAAREELRYAMLNTSKIQ